MQWYHYLPGGMLCQAGFGDFREETARILIQPFWIENAGKNPVRDARGL
jgi:hypothetical protein